MLRAIRREKTETTPIWLMRQAGRYQPEYRAIREKMSFIELCKRPETATEVTLLAVSQLGVDAAIIFADILLILEALGVGFEFTGDEGPRILEPVRQRTQVDAMPDKIDVEGTLGYVMEALRMTRAALAPEIALIGFAGAPFTLAAYIVEGGGSRSYARTKALMYSDEGLWRALMTKVSNAVFEYLLVQARSGAQVVQLFDSWVGALSVTDYRRYVLPYTKTIFDRLRGVIPTIHFGTGNPLLYPHMREAGGDVIGIDWRAPLGQTWSALDQQGAVGLMGNLDPVALLAPRDYLINAAKSVLDEAKGKAGHIFNLGHGVLPSTPFDNVKALVDAVHSYR